MGQLGRGRCALAVSAWEFWEGTGILAYFFLRKRIGLWSPEEVLAEDSGWRVEDLLWSKVNG